MIRIAIILRWVDHDGIPDHLEGGCSGIPDSPITIIFPSLRGARMWEFPLINQKPLLRWLANQRLEFRSHDLHRPIRGQYSGYVISIDQSEASITWSGPGRWRVAGGGQRWGQTLCTDPSGSDPHSHPQSAHSQTRRAVLENRKNTPYKFSEECSINGFWLRQEHKKC